MTKNELKEYLEKLQGYNGYIQYSNRPINKDRDIFLNQNLKIEDKQGFIYEAHFCNGKESISIKQINQHWLVNKTDVSNIDESDIQSYKSDIQEWNYNIKMAQIWEDVEDSLCENMRVKKLKKVVFMGFENG